MNVSKTIGYIALCRVILLLRLTSFLQHMIILSLWYWLCNWAD